MNTPDIRHSPRNVIVFDGSCVLCNGWVTFLLRHDRRRRYHFAAMQSPTGRRLLLEHGLDPADPDSFLLLEGGRAWIDGAAVRRVLTGLGGAWRLAGVLAWLPARWVDASYRLLARNRYRWFGRNAHCLVPQPADVDRFLDLDDVQVAPGHAAPSAPR